MLHHKENLIIEKHTSANPTPVPGTPLEIPPDNRLGGTLSTRLNQTLNNSDYNAGRQVVNRTANHSTNCQRFRKAPRRNIDVINQKLSTEYNPSILSPSIQNKQEGLLKTIRSPTELLDKPFINRNRQQFKSVNLSDNLKAYVDQKNQAQGGQTKEDYELMSKGKTQQLKGFLEHLHIGQYIPEYGSIEHYVKSRETRLLDAAPYLAAQAKTSRNKVLRQSLVETVGSTQRSEMKTENEATQPSVSVSPA